MKNLLFLLALVSLAAESRAAFFGVVTDTNALVNLPSPHSNNTNYYTIAEKSAWTYFENSVDNGTNALKPLLFDGRWIYQWTGGGGGGDTLWAKVVSGGVTNLQPVDLTLPLMITNALAFGPGLTNLFYRLNGGGSLAIANNDGNGYSLLHFGNTVNNVPVTIGMSPGGGGFFTSTSSQLELGVSGRSLTLTANALTANAGDALDWGSFAIPMRDIWTDRTNYLTGYWDGTSFTNYSRLATYFHGTNDDITFDSQGSGIAGPARGFRFTNAVLHVDATKGIELGGVTNTTWPGGGGSDSWTNVSGILQQVATNLTGLLFTNNAAPSTPTLLTIRNSNGTDAGFGSVNSAATVRGDQAVDLYEGLGFGTLRWTGNQLWPQLAGAILGGKADGSQSPNTPWGEVHIADIGTLFFGTNTMTQTANLPKWNGAAWPGGGVAGSIINTVAPSAAGVPLVFRGADTTNAVPGYAGEPITYSAGSYTILYTDNAKLLRWNDSTNSTVTFNDGATNGFNITLKNVGTGSLIITNNAGKTFDGLASITQLPGTVLHVIADGTNYLTGRISPKTITTGNTVYASPSDGSSGVPVMRALVSGDVPSVYPSMQISSLLVGSMAIGARSVLTEVGGVVICDLSLTNRYWTCSPTGNVQVAVINPSAGNWGNLLIRWPSTNCQFTLAWSSLSSTTNWLSGAPSTNATANTIGFLGIYPQDSTTNSTIAGYSATQ